MKVWSTRFSATHTVPFTGDTWSMVIANEETILAAEMSRLTAPIGRYPTGRVKTTPPDV
jgi:hypothetical protein